MSEHIKVIRPNRKGKDYVIGDLHGNIECLEKVLAQLGPNDNLFIAGDLMDRGPDSLAVLERIIDNNNDKSKAKIYVVRGNHEDMCLDSIKAMESIASNLGKGKDEIEPGEFIAHVRGNPKLRTHFRSAIGGKWLRHLFLSELRNKTIAINPDGSITYAPDSKVLKIKKFIDELPYIIRVRGGNGRTAFNIVHADMLFNDEKMAELRKTRRPLTKDEIDYLTWSRQNHHRVPFSPNGRNRWSSLAIVGHTMITQAGIECVRSDTNTINTDSGTYVSNVSFLVNITDKTVQMIGDINPEDAPKLEIEFNKLRQHLEEEKKAECDVLRRYAAQGSPSQIADRVKRDYPEQYLQIMHYLINNDAFYSSGIHTWEDFEKSLQQPQSPSTGPFFDKKRGPTQNENDANPPVVSKRTRVK